MCTTILGCSETSPSLEEFRHFPETLRVQASLLEQLWFVWILDWASLGPLVVGPPVLVHVFVEPLVVPVHLEG